MENKYYTPKLEELFVGYECLRYDIESQYHPTGGGVEGWLDNMYKPHVVCNPFSSNSGDYNMLTYARHIKNGNIRTPFLTKEQILKEGWEAFEKEGRSEYAPDWLWYIKPETEFNNIVMRHFKASNRIGIMRNNIHNNKFEESLYHGSCPSINEFRTIIKLLNI